MRRVIVTALLVCTLTAVLGLAGCGGTSTPANENQNSPAASENTQDLAQVKYKEAEDLFKAGKYYSAKVAFEESEYDDWEARAAECVQQMPETGEIWHAEGMESDEMALEFIVNSADEETGYYIAVYTDEHELASTVFVKGTGSIDVWLPGGNYYVKDAFGSEWYGEEEMFGPDGHYEDMIFDEVEGDKYLTALEAGYRWTITINAAEENGQGVDSEETEWGSWK